MLAYPQGMEAGQVGHPHGSGAPAAQCAGSKLGCQEAVEQLHAGAHHALDCMAQADGAGRRLGLQDPAAGEGPSEEVGHGDT